MKITEQFEKGIAPFSWADYGSGTPVCLTDDGHLHEFFDSRADDGFTGNGYDWGSLARIFLDKKTP